MSLDNFDLLDATLDDLADLKKFEPLPVGAYLFGVTWSFPANDEFNILQLDLSVKECLELPGIAEENLPAVGKKASFYMRLSRKDGQPMVWSDGTPNDQDQGRLKEVLKALAPAFNPSGTLTIREMIEATEGAEIIAQLKIKASKKDADVKFNEIVYKSVTLPE